MAELIAERLTGKPFAQYVTREMEDGKEREPLARAAYEWRYDCEVQIVGFIDHPSIAMSGASPDGLINDDGGIEIKCPAIHTHIDTLLTRRIPDKYLKQIQWNLACSGREWWHYVSFHPDMPDAMRLIVIDVHRDETMIAEIEREVRNFLAELEMKAAQLEHLFASEAPPPGQ